MKEKTMKSYKAYAEEYGLDIEVIRWVFNHRFAVRVPPPLGVGRNHGLPIPILYANVVESAL